VLPIDLERPIEESALMDRKIRVMLVDDSRDVIEPLSYLIGIEGDMECVGLLESADDLGERVRDLSPDVLLIDARMPGRDSLEAIRELASQLPEIRSVVYSGFDDRELIDSAVDASAWGWIRKGDDPALLLKAIRSVAAGKVVFPRFG